MQFVKEYFLSDIAVCDQLIDLFKIGKKLGLTTPGLTGRFEVNKKIKDSEDLAVEKLPRNNPAVPSPKDSGYDAAMRQFVEFIPRYYKDVQAAWPQPVEFRTLPHFQYYKPGGGYHTWHCDSFGDVIDRHLAFVLYMNDVPGGGTEFQHQEYVCEAKKGKVLIFPASFTYPHRSQVSMTHEKYILTGWASVAMPRRP